MTALSEKSLSVKEMSYAFKKPTTEFNLSQYSCKVRGTTYLAGMPRFINQGEDKYLNLWSGGNVIPVKGKWPTINAHFEFVLQNSEERKHWYDYFAHKLQKRHVKIKHFLLLTGGQGIGKSFFGRLFQFLLGHQNVGTVDNNQIRSEFTSGMVNKELLVIEEMMAGKQLETENILKPYITEDTVMCNEKHLPRFEAKTPRAGITFSNYKKCINLSEGERRWSVSHSNAQKQPDEYYDQLFASIETEGPAFMYYLMYEHDLGDFNPNAAPPMTEAKADLIHRSFTPIRAALIDLIEAGSRPFHKDIVSSAELDLHLSMCPNVSARSREPRNVSDTLKQMGSVSLGQRMVKGKRHSLWIIRHQEKWSQEESEAIRNEFTK